MKKIFLFLILPLASFADPNWPVYLHPEEECEEVVGYLRDRVESIAEDAAYYPLFVRDMSDEFYNVYNLVIDSADSNLVSQAQNYRIEFNAAVARFNSGIDDFQFSASNLLNNVNQINCTTCIEEVPGGNGSTNCCDFTGLYNRLDNLIQIQQTIQSKVSLLDSILSTVQQIKTNLDYTNFLLEHGFNSITNMLLGSDENVDLVDSYRYLSAFGSPAINDMYWPLEPYTIGQVLYTSTMNENFAIGSLNNYAYDFRNRIIPYFGHVTNAIPVITNSLLYVADSLAASSPLLYFDSAVEERDYYTYLTNYYFAILRGDEEIEESHKTNWFTRVETLLAALVFADGSKSNLTEHVEDSVTNSINNVTDRFESFFDEVSGAPTSQIELVGDVEKSMYQSLRQFSSAFSDATMPRSVRVIRVEKSVGSKSVADVVDVSVEVEGRLSDLVELLRSATTLCWVFVGLWFMFKFSVWTVKKIYLLSRYAIDFFNMILGGK